MVKNAIQHGGADLRRIQVGMTLDEQSKAVVMCIDDDGRGVPESERGRIFQAGVSQNFESTGLGLSLVKRVFEEGATRCFRSSAAREAAQCARAGARSPHGLPSQWQPRSDSRRALGRSHGRAEPAKKGALLEELMLVLWRSIPGFEQTVRNRQSPDEEIDLVIINQSDDAFWKRESQLIVVECKNRSTKAKPIEIDRFLQVISRRQGRCKLGFFVSLEGFTAGVDSTLAANRKEDKVVVLLARAELQSLVLAGSPDQRNQLLKDFVLRTVVENR